MKYWAYFAAKLAVLAGVLFGIWQIMLLLLPEPTAIGGYRLGRFGQDFGWTTAIFFYFLVSMGGLALVVLDQRYRCRTCLRRLRMPVRNGAFDKILRIGSPRMEYICPFGHGTLDVHEIHFAGRQGDSWRQHDDDIWKELEGLYAKPGEK